MFFATRAVQTLGGELFPLLGLLMDHRPAFRREEAGSPWLAWLRPDSVPFRRMVFEGSTEPRIHQAPSSPEFQIWESAKVPHGIHRDGIIRVRGKIGSCLP
jgi:hypothetical protein